MCLDAMSGARWFSMFDLRSSYHQVAMKEEDFDKKSVCLQRGTVQVHYHAIWTLQCWGYVPEVDGYGDVWTGLRGVPGLP